MAQSPEWKSITKADFVQKTEFYDENEKSYANFVQTINTHTDTCLNIDESVEYRVFIDKAGNSYFWEKTRKSSKNEFLMSPEFVEKMQTTLMYFESNFTLRPTYFVDISNSGKETEIYDPDCFLNPTTEMDELYHHMIVSNGAKEVMIDYDFHKHSSTFWDFLTGYYMYKNGIAGVSLYDVLYRTLSDEEVLDKSMSKKLYTLKKFFTNYPQIALDEYPQYIPPQIDYSTLIKRDGPCWAKGSSQQDTLVTLKENTNSIESALFQLFGKK